MPESEAGTPPVSAPATPGTPAPLFTSLRVDSLSYDRNSMPRCKCLPVNAPTWGQPHTCFTDFAAPDVSLTRKVSLSLSLSLSLPPPKSDFFLPTFSLLVIECIGGQIRYLLFLAHLISSSKQNFRELSTLYCIRLSSGHNDLLWSEWQRVQLYIYT
jgi:hypothetical protein